MRLICKNTKLGYDVILLYFVSNESLTSFSASIKGLSFERISRMSTSVVSTKNFENIDKMNSSVCGLQNASK
jgi:hypothetical protein